jgi:serine/threonine-protein kinase
VEEVTGSILRRIEKLSGPTPRLLLHDLADADSPIVAPHADTVADGRYQIFGEIARGGVGIIRKGRDVDLGREIAMKTLRPEYGEHEEVLERFVEEAQIGGQLQHPGIVPVYELGLDESKRLYFTMKLIKGRTFADLLSERTAPSQDLARAIGIFEKVCQAMAYAHARKVIHRDLKTANIMTGPFGEVLVLDWGFAKVLGRPSRETELPQRSVIKTMRSDDGSASVAGSILGTPAYMPPEQALGEVAAIGPPSDVFSLGAILCEILTGQPPYLPEQGNLLLLAASAQLGPAFERLDASGAPAALVSLAKSCLAAEPAQRPANAEAVAQAAGAYLASEEERAHAGAVAAAQARVRAAAERRARRLSLGVAATLLAAITAVVGGMVGRRHAETRRAATAANLVGRSLDDLKRKWEFAKHAPPRERAPWREAVDAARDAVALAEQRGAEADLLEHARSQLAAVETEARDADRRAARIERDDRMAADLQAARLGLLGTKQRGFGEVFAEYGIDFARLSPEQAATSIRESAIADELIEALDTWALSRRAYSRLAGEEARHLLATLELADDNAWRRDVRAAAAAWDNAALRAAAHEIPDEAFDDRSAPFVANLLLRRRMAPLAVRIMRSAYARWPTDLVVLNRLGNALMHERDPPWAELIGYYRAALGLAPHAAFVRKHFASALIEYGAEDEAWAILMPVLRATPMALESEQRIRRLMRESDTAEDVTRMFRAEADQAGDDAAAWHRLGALLLLRGKTAAAVDPLAKARDLDASVFEHRYALAIAQLELGNHAEVEATLKGISIEEQPRAAGLLGFALKFQRRYSEAADAFGTANRAYPVMSRQIQELLCLKFAGRLDEALAMAGKAAPSVPYAPWHYFHADLLAVAGKPEQAVAIFDRALKRRPRLNAEQRASAHRDSAYGLLKLDRADEARAAYGRFTEDPVHVAGFARQVELAQGQPPAGAGDLVHAARLHTGLGRFWTAVGFFERAFEAEPALRAQTDDRAFSNALHAAIAAGSAASGFLDEPITGTQRAHARSRALAWAREAVAAAPVDARPAVIALLRKAAALAPVREPRLLARLDEKEREACRAFWAEVR